MIEDEFNLKEYNEISYSQLFEWSKHIRYSNLRAFRLIEMIISKFQQRPNLLRNDQVKWFNLEDKEFKINWKYIKVKDQFFFRRENETLCQEILYGKVLDNLRLINRENFIYLNKIPELSIKYIGIQELYEIKINAHDYNGMIKKYKEIIRLLSDMNCAFSKELKI